MIPGWLIRKVVESSSIALSVCTAGARYALMPAEM
jgi:hypothetical protein